MRSLFPALLSFVTLYMCVSACVYQYMCDPLMTGSILYNLDFSVRRSVASFYVSFHPSVSFIFHFLSVSISASAKYETVTLL